MFCRFCGEPIDKTDNFCINCGSQVKQFHNHRINDFDSKPINQPSNQLDTSSKKNTAIGIMLAIIVLIMSIITPRVCILLSILLIVYYKKENQNSALVISIIALLISLLFVFEPDFLFYLRRKISFYFF